MKKDMEAQEVASWLAGHFGEEYSSEGIYSVMYSPSRKISTFCGGPGAGQVSIQEPGDLVRGFESESEARLFYDELKLMVSEDEDENWEDEDYDSWEEEEADYYREMTPTAWEVAYSPAGEQVYLVEILLVPVAGQIFRSLRQLAGQTFLLQSGDIVRTFDGEEEAVAYYEVMSMLLRQSREAQKRYYNDLLHTATAWGRGDKKHV